MPNRCVEIKLIRPIKKPGVNGAGFRQPNGEEISRIVFADVKSVGHTEFFEAKQAGTKADLKFDLWVAEYEGEKIIEYDGMRYKVIRDYVVKNKDKIELTVTSLGISQGGDG